MKVIQIEDNTHKELKMRALESGLSMKDFVQVLLDGIDEIVLDTIETKAILASLKKDK